MLSGGCFCGRVRYEAHGEPRNVTLCHCDDCRRAAAAPMVGWFTVATGDFRVTEGASSAWGSSPGVTRGFCRDCGTQLTYQREDSANEIDVTICSLDNPNMLTPQDHTYAAAKLPWIVIQDGLPAYSRLRPD